MKRYVDTVSRLDPTAYIIHTLGVNRRVVEVPRIRNGVPPRNRDRTSATSTAARWVRVGSIEHIDRPDPKMLASLVARKTAIYSGCCDANDALWMDRVLLSCWKSGERDRIVAVGIRR